jgi:6-phosphogluconate dehydrogenase
MSKLADIGLAGLAAMGENLVLNMESNDYTLTIYNRSTDKLTFYRKE